MSFHTVSFIFASIMFVLGKQIPYVLKSNNFKPHFIDITRTVLSTINFIYELIKIKFTMELMLIVDIVK